MNIWILFGHLMTLNNAERPKHRVCVIENNQVMASIRNQSKQRSENQRLRFESLAQHRQVACRGRLGPTGEGPAGGRLRSYQRGEVVGR